MVGLREDPVRWGVLGAARIAVRKVIPAIQASPCGTVVAIGSRDTARAGSAASALGIARAYGSYDEVLGDPEVEAVYVPLPNHLHVPWSIRALEAGKHVLCEKPVGLTAAEAETLVAARDRTGLLAQEAFVVRTHPRWRAVHALVEAGRIGAPRQVAAQFSFFNEDPANVRNIAAIGGGSLLDIGCYPVTLSRWLLGREPVRVLAAMDRDPRFGTDRLTSAILDFGEAHAVFTCSTQAAMRQRFEIVGTLGRIEVEIPFGAPPDRPTRVVLDPGQDLLGTAADTVEFETCDQYGVLTDGFAAAVRGFGPLAVPLEDAARNMRVLDALARSAAGGAWEAP